ncbi:MAG TPA: LysR family transcriptional regulator [Stellaceae bacterium]|jgi:DNA-binding transcriptional LysR family regulator|nr:LysR family transcriptional regulator [Stellaceae bacterium]
MDIENWDLARAFLAVIRAGSLSGAARALGLTQPTIGRQIENFETRLGVPLFTRSRHGVKPTQAALDLIPHVEIMAAAMAALKRAASGEASAPRGTVRLTASELMGAAVLPPMLTRFHAAHPGIAIELVLSNRIEDLLRHEADIAVRMVRPDQAALVARHIGPVPIALYAHRDYIARHGLPRSLEALTGHTLIGFDASPWGAAFLATQSGPVTRDRFNLRTDSDLAQLAALRAGYGIGACQEALGRRDPNLVPVMHDSFRPMLDCWLVMHEDLRTSRRVRLLFDHLGVELNAYLQG